MSQYIQQILSVNTTLILKSNRWCGYYSHMLQKWIIIGNIPRGPCPFTLDYSFCIS